jgi:hypothetical protein
MARVGRLAGAILVETRGDHYLVGHPKVPCDWRAVGFEPPAEPSGLNAPGARVTPVVRLRRVAAHAAAPLSTPPLASQAAPQLAPPQLAPPLLAPPLLAPPLLAPPLLAPPLLAIDLEGEPLVRLLADRLVIARTGSVSERLWRLVIGESDDDTGDDAGDAAGDPASERAGGSRSDVIPARWLGELPPAIWQIVRDTVLRCT